MRRAGLIKFGGWQSDIDVNTLLLDTAVWDLVLDGNGNIAMATDPYSLAQDVASACRTFLGEVWYDTTIGVPYFSQILGKRPSLALIKRRLVEAALTVPGCTNPVVYISSVKGRIVTGQIQFTDSNTGALQVAAVYNPFILGSSILGGGGAI